MSIYFDTYLLGTFTGEFERKYDPFTKVKINALMQWN